MEISSTYSTPVMVNGYSCRSCSEVAKAERNIDPANAGGGPDGLGNSQKAQTADDGKSVFDARKVDDTIAALEAQRDQNRVPRGNDPYALAAASAAPPPGQLVSLTA